MDTGLTPEDLRRFELEIFQLFKDKKIHSPIHLRGGNEQQLIKIFKDIQSDDYCFLTWASHLECLLKGVDREKVKEKILNNKSICMSFKEHNIISSAIVAGNAPIAVGVAMGIKKQNKKNKVWCFVGDMAFYTGTVQEAIRYSEVNDLPITFVVADNGLSVTTPTEKIWGNDIENICKNSSKCLYYKYTNAFPHAGIGEKVLF
jgi:TPP-dependent pyruvate/acetoin dehydrogenase alpha subunit